MRGWLPGLMVGLFVGGLVVFAGEESITMTTYYPSPRGVYDELRANRVVLTDRQTGSTYSLTMEQGKLLLTDLQGSKAFVILELPESP